MENIKSSILDAEFLAKISRMLSPAHSHRNDAIFRMETRSTTRRDAQS